MNKWRIIVPLAALALPLLPVTPRYVRRLNMYRRDAVTQRALQVARDLESTTNSTLLVRIPPRLHQELINLLTTPTAYLETFRFGDEPAPIGDGTATHRVYLRSLENEKSLALRLRYDASLKQFHVLGFWHPESWPQ